MRYLFILLLTVSAFSHASVSVNAPGKTIDQFLFMASEVLGKVVVADPNVDGTLKVYGVSKANFNKVFYNVLRSHGLAYHETDNLIRIYRSTSESGHSTITDRDSLYDFIASSVSDVFISGSMSYYKAGSMPSFDYAFVQGVSRKVFDPSNIGLRVVPIHSCLAQLVFDTYVTFVTCEPYRIPKQPEPVAGDIPSIFENNDMMPDNSFGDRKEKQQSNENVN